MALGIICQTVDTLAYGFKLLDCADFAGKVLEDTFLCGIKEYTSKPHAHYRTMSSIDNPSVAMYASDFGRRDNHSSDYISTGRFTDRHSADYRLNMVMLDGHVEQHTVQEMMDCPAEDYNKNVSGVNATDHFLARGFKLL